MFVTWRYGITSHKITQNGETYYRLVDYHTEKVIDEGFGEETLERLKAKKWEIEVKEA